MTEKNMIINILTTYAFNVAKMLLKQFNNIIFNFRTAIWSRQG
jgi:hypothetical protein